MISSKSSGILNFLKLCSWPGQTLFSAIVPKVCKGKVRRNKIKNNFINTFVIKKQPTSVVLRKQDNIREKIKKANTNMARIANAHKQILKRNLVTMPTTKTSKSADYFEAKFKLEFANHYFETSGRFCSFIA